MSSFESSGFDGFLEKADQQFPKNVENFALKQILDVLNDNNKERGSFTYIQTTLAAP